MKKVCRHFEKSGECISVETDDDYYIGKVTQVSGKHILFEWFDARGEWYEPVRIKISDIRLITYKSRYVQVFQNTLKKVIICKRPTAKAVSIMFMTRITSATPAL